MGRHLSRPIGGTVIGRAASGGTAARLTAAAAVALTLILSLGGGQGALVARADASPLDLHTLTLRRLGATPTQLQGGIASARFTVPVPHAWTAAGVSVDLRWQGSNLLGADSTITVLIDDVARAAAVIGPGGGELVVTAPQEPIATSHAVTMEARVRLHTAQLDCPPPDAAGAYVSIDPDSTIQVQGVRAGPAAVLSDFPDLFVERWGDTVEPLTVALPANPTPPMFRAAVILASSVDIAAGFPGVPVQVITGATPAQLDSLPTDVISIQTATGAPKVTVGPTASGRSLLSLAAPADKLAGAAWSLRSPSSTASLTGTDATVGTSIDTNPPAPPALTSKLPASELHGAGVQTLHVLFKLPSGQVTEGSGTLHLPFTYDAPGGGRVDVAVNGQDVGAKVLSTTGSTQVVMDVSVPANLAKAGDNSVDITSDMPLAASGRCALLQSIPGLKTGSGGLITMHGRSRGFTLALDYWPWPFDSSSWTNTVVALPANPTAAEMQAVMQALVEVSRWEGKPVAPNVVFGTPSQHGSRNLVLLVRGVHPPPGVGLQGAGSDGQLEVDPYGQGLALVAFGPRGLGAIGSGYFAGKVTGRSIVVDERGRVQQLAGSLEESPPLSQLPITLGPDLIPIAIGLLLLLMLWRALHRLGPRVPDVAPASGSSETAGRAGKAGSVESPVGDRRARERRTRDRRTADEEEAVERWRGLSNPKEPTDTA